MLERRARRRACRAGTRHVDDPALAPFEHRGERGLREVERRVHVDLEDDAPPLQRHLRGLRVHRRRRVVHEDVDRAAELLGRLGHDAGAVVAVGEVGGDDRDRVAVRRAAARRSR